MRKPFTLVELLIAMSVLSVFMLGLMQFFSTTESVLSAGANRTEMFERARIAMDMMANDLTCVYYSQTDKNVIPFKSTDTSFQVATVRPDKLDSSAKTNIVGVEYKWDSGSHTLKYATSDKDMFSVEDGGLGAEKTLIDGVWKFNVEVLEESKLVESGLPNSVLITMTLVDKKTLKRLEANSGLDENKMSMDKREFRRIVIIDRGQREIK